MPEQFEKFDPTWQHRLAAWEAHYIAKGCSRSKASALARKKRFKRSMPPVDTDNVL